MKITGVLNLGLSYILMITFLSGINAQNETVNWMSMQEALDLSKQHPKKIFIDVYTDWCGWCKRMDKATFQQPHIAKYLNENYYNVKFNAEDKAEIVYNDRTHTFVRGRNGRGYNTMAAEIMRGQMSYPTIVFMNEQSEVLQPIPGFQDPKTFEVIMTFFAEDHYKTTPWKKYHDNYVFIQERSEARPASLKQP